MPLVTDARILAYFNVLNVAHENDPKLIGIAYQVSFTLRQKSSGFWNINFALKNHKFGAIFANVSTQLKANTHPGTYSIGDTISVENLLSFQISSVLSGGNT
jgi:hypothetical protein